MTIKTDVSTTLDFLTAAREMQTAINGALDTALKTCRQNNYFGLSSADLGTLHAILEAEGTTSAPLEIAKQSGTNKGAFTRTMSNLEGNEFVLLKKEGRKIVHVELTNSGKKVAKFYQAELNQIIPKLRKEPAVQNFAKHALGQK